MFPVQLFVVSTLVHELRVKQSELRCSGRQDDQHKGEGKNKNVKSKSAVFLNQVNTGQPEIENWLVDVRYCQRAEYHL